MLGVAERSVDKDVDTRDGDRERHRVPKRRRTLSAGRGFHAEVGESAGDSSEDERGESLLKCAGVLRGRAAKGARRGGKRRRRRRRR